MRLPKWLRLSSLGLGTCLLWLAILISVTRTGIGGDWLAYYSAGYAVVTHNVANLYDLSLLQQWLGPYMPEHAMPFVYVNLPAFIPLFTPLGLLPILGARLVWLAVTALCAYASARISCRLTGLPLLDTLFALAAFFPLTISLYDGQISTILLLLFTLLALRERQHRSGYADGFLAGGLLLKPQFLPSLGLYWLYRRRWRSLAALVALTLVVLVACFLVSVPLARVYFSALSPVLLSRAGGIARGYHATISGLGGPVLGIVAALVAFALLYLVWRRPATPYSEAMLWLSPLIVSPYSGPYDLLLAAVPVACLAPVLPGDRVLQVAVAIVWLTPLGYFAGIGPTPAVAAIVLLFAICAVRALSAAYAPTLSSALPTGSPSER